MKKQFLIIITSLLVILLVISGITILWRIYSTATFIVVASQGAKIYVKQDSNDFIEIGSSNAEYKTRRRGTVFFEARLNNQVTQTSLQPKRNTSQNVQLTFQPIVDAQIFANGALTNMFIENNFVYGVNPSTNAVTALPIIPNTSQPPTVPILPFLNQVVWINSKNFYAVTLGRGTEKVENNKTSEDKLYPYVQIATSNKSAILLSPDGFYYSQNIDLDKSTKINDLIPNSTPQVFADNYYLYSINLIQTKSNDESDVLEAKENQLTIYNQDGKKQFYLVIPVKTKIYKVSALSNNKIALLTDNQIVLLDLDTKETTIKDFSFGEVQDMVFYKNNLLLLGTDGLWQYNQATQNYSRIANYPKNQEYVPNSLTILGNTLLLSASADLDAIKKQEKVLNNIYKIDL